ncbi:MAG: serine/threonine protein kinase [Deltaproteobacteria bacterium]|nr:serine/threonine protein kinase [Deltaproteobacteria bacterium]
MALRIVSLSGRPTPSKEGAPACTPAQEQRSVARAEPGVASLTGDLGPGRGTRLLVHLFLEERTGRLVIDGGAAAGTLFFLGGEPVHWAIADGGAALERRVRARGPLRDTAPGRHVLATLARRAGPVVVLEALRDEVREACRHVLSAELGAWGFFDDAEAIDATPLSGVNPFGFVLEAQLRALPPTELLRLAERVAPLFPIATGELASAAARIKSFTGGIDLALVVDGTKAAREVLAAARLDPMMGGMVLQTLADSGLVQLSPTPKPRAEHARRHAGAASAQPTLAQADAKLLSQLSALPQGATEVLNLYLELKPETDIDAVLGLSGSAGLAAIERAYQQRLAELDPRAVPPGPHRPYLLARADELRAKVERAYLARTANRPRAKTTAAYQLFDRIGAGGMAEVYRGVRADDPNHFIAIKCILPALREDPKFCEMFLQEARLARRIQHPNVVRVLTVGRGAEDLYLAMEYIDGLDFGDLLRRGREQGCPASVELVCRVIADASAGLHAAHTAQNGAGAVEPILHRDVSPQNILVSRTGEVKLSDFGIAKALGSHDEEHGAVKGKVPYFAPELLQGEPASVKSDVYAMAMTMYHALARLPFQRGDRLATMRAILDEPLAPLSSMVPGVPPILDALLLSAAARNPAERHASAQQLRLELEEILAQWPPVDVAGWARALVGSRGEKGLIGRPITNIRSATGLTGVAVTEPGVVMSAEGGPTSPGSEDVDLDDL